MKVKLLPTIEPSIDQREWVDKICIERKTSIAAYIRQLIQQDMDADKLLNSESMTK